jgi:hypothetical protein
MPHNTKRYQADVVIIGGGIAGLATACELLDSGKKVLILDRDNQEKLGGLAKESFGGIMAVDTPLQRKAGIEDSFETAYSDWLRYANFGENSQLQKEWAKKYVEYSSPLIYEWLVNKGDTYFNSFYKLMQKYCLQKLSLSYHLNVESERTQHVCAQEDSISRTHTCCLRVLQRWGFRRQRPQIQQGPCLYMSHSQVPAEAAVALDFQTCPLPHACHQSWHSHLLCDYPLALVACVLLLLRSTPAA